MPALPRLPDGTVVYPGMATITTMAGTFVQALVTDGVLRFNCRVPLDRRVALTHCAVDQLGVEGRWRPPEGMPMSHGKEAWTLDDGYTFYVMAVAVASSRVEVEIRGNNPHTTASFPDVRTLSGPWLKKGWQLVRPITFFGGDSLLNRILVGGLRAREKHRGEPIAIDLSYLLVRKPETT